MPKLTDINNINKGSNWHTSNKGSDQPAAHKTVTMAGYRVKKQLDERKRALESVIESSRKLDW